MLLIGDALDQLRTLESESVAGTVTSPPYWGCIDYQVEGQTGMEDSIYDYLSYQQDVWGEVLRVTVPGGALMLNIGNKWNNLSVVRSRANGIKQKVHDSTLPRTPIQGAWKEKESIDLPGCLKRACRSAGWILRDEYIWVKPSGRPVKSDRSAAAYETVLYFRKPTHRRRYYAHYWDGTHLPTNVLKFHPASDTAHPCPMPYEMAEALVLATVPLGETVLDPFAGSGTVLKVAELHGREAIGIDLKDWSHG